MEEKATDEIIYITPAHKQLKRENEKEEMTRIEEAARTVEDFQKIIDKDWDRIDSNHRRRERRYELKLGRLIEEMVEVGTEGAVIPQPLNDMWWRQMMRGDFLDVIFNCPYDIHELTEDSTISKLVDGLSDNQKEVLYLRAIWQWSPQKIAVMRGQTDRNIRKVYDTLIEGLRKDLFERLLPRFMRKLPLTFAQREFVLNDAEKYCTEKEKAALTAALINDIINILKKYINSKL